MCGMEKFRLSLLVCLLWMLITCKCAEWDDLTICYVGYRNVNTYERKYCSKIQAVTKNRIRCVYAVDRLRCMEQLLAGRVDLGVFKAEDLFLLTQLSVGTVNETEQDLVITNEFQTYSAQEHEFDMVTLVSNNVEINSLADLRGKRLCHPGFDEHGWLNDFSEIFLQYFEEVVVPEQCDPELSVLENKINSADSFFDSSCKPGPWSPETNIDQKLKSRYNRLCENCGTPSVCSHRDLYWGPQGAVTCMLDCRGDVAWAKLKIVDYSFQKHTSCQDVSFLCLDGTKQPLNTTNPCIWISRPWPVVLTRKVTQKKVTALIDYINNATLSDADSWEYAVRLVLGNTLQPIRAIDPISPRDYLNRVPGFVDASEKKTCRGTGQDIVIRVCVENSKVLEKCNLMAKVANVYSIDPEFKCVLMKECMGSVVNEKSDVFITSIENLRAVYEHKNLKVIMYQTTEDYSELRYSAAIVQNGSTIQSLKDLRGKKACFTQYNGLGWNSMLMALNESSIVTDICNGTKVFKEFFSDVCVIDHRNGDPVRGCFETSEDGYTPVGSLHINEAEGLRCILEGGGDVAFIDQNYIGKYLEENKNAPWSNRDVNDFRSVCPPEHAVDSDCYLSRATFGMIVARENISTDREEEIISAFLILSSLLGEKFNINNNYYYEPKILRLFTHYYNEKNVLFESSAGQLESTDQYFTRGRFSVKNFYEKNLQILEDTCAEEKHQEVSTSTLVMISNYAVILCSFTSVILMNT